MSCKHAKYIFVAALLFISSNKLFAVEEYISKIYKDIDKVFVEKSDNGLNEILQNNKKDKNYYLIEKYAEKKVRRLIVDKNYDFAMSAILVIIDNNLDNEGAVDMYQTIVEAYEIQQDYEAKKEQERLIELARIELEKEKQRGAADKEYVSAKTATGQGVYVNGKENKLSTQKTDFAFGFINCAFTQETSLAYNGMNFGITGLLNYVHERTTIMAGADVFGGFNFLTMNAEKPDISLIADLDIVPKIAYKPFSKYIFLRAGVSLTKIGKAKRADQVANIENQIISPIIGFEINRAKLGPMYFTFNVDYLLSTLWTDKIKVGAQSMIDISIPFSELEKVKLNFHIGARDRVLVKNNGLENRVEVMLSIGAENVNK